MPANTVEKAVHTTYLSIFGNIGLALVKWVAGYFGNSYALIADAIESTTDIFSSLLVLVGLRYASKPADDNHPYGHGRAEPLVTFVVTAFLVGSAVLIAYESIHNIVTPHELPKPFTLLVLGAVIIGKEFAFRYVSRKGAETKSTSVTADAWHHRSDAITSAAAFVGISIALILGKGYESADDWAALFAAGFILYNSYHIFRPALSEVMDEHIHDDMIAEVRRISAGVPGVINTEKCFIRKAGMTYHIDLHAIVDATITVHQGHEIAHRLKDTLKQELPEVSDVLIHVEPEE